MATAKTSALKLSTKSVQTRKQDSDGMRILVARFRGRGVPSTAYDVWMANLGPSERLLHDYLGGRLTWAQYSKRYRAELFEPGRVDERNRTIKNHGQKFTLRLIKELARREPVTLLCHCDEVEAHCHRHLLKKLIESSRI